MTKHIQFLIRARAAWARLIRKVYEADPLECAKCKGPMRVIALIEDPGVIRRILEHVGLWAPVAIERGPPLGIALNGVGPMQVFDPAMQ